MRTLLNSTKYFTGREGQLFKFFAHQKLADGGKFDTRNLRTNSKEHLLLNKLDLCPFAQASELMNYKDRQNVYLKPTPKNFESCTNRYSEVRRLQVCML